MVNVPLGLTPKIETAIVDALQKGAAQCAGKLIATLHPADQDTAKVTNAIYAAIY